jgi:hypothetical protein
MKAKGWEKTREAASIKGNRQDATLFTGNPQDFIRHHGHMTRGPRGTIFPWPPTNRYNGSRDALLKNFSDVNLTKPSNTITSNHRVARCLRPFSNLSAIWAPFVHFRIQFWFPCYKLNSSVTLSRQTIKAKSPAAKTSR